ncbi:hypothetical protein KKB10_02950 [Patescibacteria group bacterium]|nr:hypothetical protein [Patescibacteria group bacterium]MBU1074833.1 hypothetical protein [Patescibacteria group bacterium]MBU1952160.1 hypothetical protein [Patescibacteria group bacterium]MBU2236115.1 hypothetical protein [Patescibacteria group bacterium]
MKKAIPIISTLLVVGALLYVGILMFSGYTNEKEIVNYLEQNKLDIPEGKEVVEMRGLLPNDPTTKNISEDTKIIVHGKVEKITDPYKGDHDAVYHDILIKPKEVFKNVAKVDENELLTAEIYGGEIDDVTYWSPGAASFKEGEEVILFLGKVDGFDKYYVSYGVYGKLTIENGIVNGINKEDGLVDMSLEKYTEKLNRVLSSS